MLQKNVLFIPGNTDLGLYVLEKSPYFCCYVPGPLNIEEKIKQKEFNSAVVIGHSNSKELSILIGFLSKKMPVNILGSAHCPELSEDNQFSTFLDHSSLSIKTFDLIEFEKIYDEIENAIKGKEIFSLDFQIPLEEIALSELTPEVASEKKIREEMLPISFAKIFSVFSKKKSFNRKICFSEKKKITTFEFFENEDGESIEEIDEPRKKTYSHYCNVVFDRDISNFSVNVGCKDEFISINLEMDLIVSFPNMIEKLNNLENN